MFDSNVLLDIVTADAKWMEWSSEQFRRAAKAGPVLINPSSRRLSIRRPRSTIGCARNPFAFTV